eukprot:Colp12_sorted_trinity150504_noHs@13658
MEEDDVWNTKQLPCLRFPVKTVEVSLSQDSETGDHSSTVWDSAKCLFKYMESEIFAKPKPLGRAIELGSGCGLVGICCAVLSQKEGFSEIVMTDRPEAIQRLTSNILKNEDLIGRKVKVRSEVLFWGNDEHIKNVDPPFDFVLVTDCVYAIELIGILVDTIVKVSSPRATVLVALERRDDQVVDTFLASLRAQGFDQMHLTMKRVNKQWRTDAVEMYKFKRTHTNTVV